MGPITLRMSLIDDFVMVGKGNRRRNKEKMKGSLDDDSSNVDPTCVDDIIIPKESDRDYSCSNNNNNDNIKSASTTTTAITNTNLTTDNSDDKIRDINIILDEHEKDEDANDNGNIIHDAKEKGNDNCNDEGKYNNGRCYNSGYQVIA